MPIKYRELVNRLHDYMCKPHQQFKLQIHQSHRSNTNLLRARVICFIYLTVIYLWALYEMGSITTNFIYLTMQGYTITWIFYAIVLQDYLFTKSFGHSFKFCQKLKHYVQIIYQTAFCFQLPITLIFWTFLFKILLESQSTTVSDIIMNTNLHAGPIICLLIDLYYNTFTFQKQHFWVLLIYGTGYMIINLIYSLSVKVIYKPIDWKSILSYALLLASLVLVYGAHFFGRFTHKKWKAPILRNRIKQGLIEQNQIMGFDNNKNSDTTKQDLENKKNPYGKENFSNLTNQTPSSDRQSQNKREVLL